VDGARSVLRLSAQYPSQAGFAGTIRPQARPLRARLQRPANILQRGQSPIDKIDTFKF
jgi:hypothetical protein